MSECGIQGAAPQPAQAPFPGSPWPCPQKVRWTSRIGITLCRPSCRLNPVVLLPFGTPFSSVLPVFSPGSSSSLSYLLGTLPEHCSPWGAQLPENCTDIIVHLQKKKKKPEVLFALWSRIFYFLWKDLTHMLWKLYFCVFLHLHVIDED